MFALPGDLEVTVWARTPDFRNASNMDIDAQGRIWLTEAYNYRQHAGNDPAGDRVMVRKTRTATEKRIRVTSWCTNRACSRRWASR